MSFEIQVTHIFDSNNIIEVRNPFSHLSLLCTLLSPNIKEFRFYVMNGNLPIREEFFDTRAYAVVFQQVNSSRKIEFLSRTCSEINLLCTVHTYIRTTVTSVCTYITSVEKILWASIKKKHIRLLNRNNSYKMTQTLWADYMYSWPDTIGGRLKHN